MLVVMNHIAVVVLQGPKEKILLAVKQGHQSAMIQKLLRTIVHPVRTTLLHAAYATRTNLHVLFRAFLDLQEVVNRIQNEAKQHSGVLFCSIQHSDIDLSSYDLKNERINSSSKGINI
jgi:hypothetical protein